MITVKHLYKKFNQLLVLKNINFHIDQGQIITIIGPSGAGKSTFLKCLDLINYFSQGQIVFKRTKLSSKMREKDKNKLRTHIGIVFQRFNLFSNFDVLKNIIYAPMVVNKIPKQKAIQKAGQLLDEVGLESKARAYPSSLSGGQQQRIAIVRALAMHPDLLLLDEPTSSLDPKMSNDVLKMIERLASRGMTMVIVTHEMDFARKISDKTYFMDHGSFIVSGDPQKIFDHSKNKVVRDFVNE